VTAPADPPGGDAPRAREAPRAPEIHTTHLRHAIRLAQAARDRGDHPFGAIVVAPDATVIEGLNSVVTQNDPTGHAETNLVRNAAAALPAGVLAASTLYTSTEPCAMCAGAIYWSGIGRVVYALGEDELIRMVDAQEGIPTLALPCREVFARGGRPIEVVGPVPLPDAIAVHRGFWTIDKEHS
jgi:tRNA(Arg) A34 adenosine deaminase TadA